MIRWALILGLAGAAAAQQGTVAGPSSGVVFDRTAGALRPVLGVPGAATLGEGMALAYGVNWIAVAPRFDSAVAAAQDGSLHFLRLTSGGISERTVAGISSVPREALFSPSGTAAALEWSGEAQIVTGLPDAPALTGAPTRLGARGTRAAALSDDGAVLLVTDGNTVQIAGSGTEVAAGSLAAFAPGSHDAAIANGTGLSLVRDVTGAAQSIVLAAEGVTNPVAVAFSADGANVFVAGAAGVTEWPTGSGFSVFVSCPCQPATLAAMGALFRLNEPGQGPLWLFDPTGQTPRTVFVPAPQ